MYVDDKSPEGHTSEAPGERDEGELYDNSIPVTITDDGDRRASGVESTPRHEDDNCDDDDDDDDTSCCCCFCCTSFFHRAICQSRER